MDDSPAHPTLCRDQWRVEGWKQVEWWDGIVVVWESTVAAASLPANQSFSRTVSKWVDNGEECYGVDCCSLPSSNLSVSRVISQFSRTISKWVDRDVECMAFIVLI